VREARIFHDRGSTSQQACCVESSRQFRDLVRNELVVGEFPAEHLMCLGKIDHLIETRLGNPDGLRGDSDAATIESMHGDLESLTFFAEQVLRRNPHLIENQLHRIGATYAEFFLLLADREAGHRLLDHEGTDPA